MAPIQPLHHLTRSTNRYYNHSHSSGVGAGVGGGVVGFIILLMIVTFFIVLFYQYSKASKIRKETGRPVLWGPVLKKAFLYAITIGIAGCCCAECFGDSNGAAPAAQGGDAGGVGGGYVPQMQQPMPSYQPQGMDYTPVQSAAQDGVQG